MNDWRINQEQKEYWKDKTFLQIMFPEFWQRAFTLKNNFYHYVFAEAKQHVENLKASDELLKEDKCKEIWHRHCDFCTKEITTEIQKVCYCTEDGCDWVCAECFNDFKAYFRWQATKVQDIPAEGFIELKVKIAE